MCILNRKINLYLINTTFKIIRNSNWVHITVVSEVGFKKVLGELKKYFFGKNKTLNKILEEVQKFVIERKGRTKIKSWKILEEPENQHLEKEQNRVLEKDDSGRAREDFRGTEIDCRRTWKKAFWNKKNIEYEKRLLLEEKIKGKF